MAYGRKYNEIEQFWVNPQMLELFDIKPEELVIQCVINKNTLHFKRNGKIYELQMDFTKDDHGKDYINYITLGVSYGDDTRYGNFIDLLRLDNISTIEHLRKFKKLMDTYFTDYVIHESIKEDE